MLTMPHGISWFSMGHCKQYAMLRNVVVSRRWLQSSSVSAVWNHDLSCARVPDLPQRLSQHCACRSFLKLRRSFLQYRRQPFVTAYAVDVVSQDNAIVLQAGLTLELDILCATRRKVTRERQTRESTRSCFHVATSPAGRCVTNTSLLGRWRRHLDFRLRYVPCSYFYGYICQRCVAARLGEFSHEGQSPEKGINHQSMGNGGGGAKMSLLDSNRAL